MFISHKGFLARGGPAAVNIKAMGLLFSNRSKRGNSDCDTLSQKESKEKEGRESRRRRKGKERDKEKGDY